MELCNGTLLYFGKGIFRTLTYLGLEAYLEPWHNQSADIFRTVVYLEPATCSEHY